MMGPSLQWHLNGGAGGIQHFMEHLMNPMAGLIGSLSAPDVTDALKQSVADGVLRETGSRSVESLAQQENELILDLLAQRAKLAL
jgi:hypothetical protein